MFSSIEHEFQKNLKSLARTRHRYTHAHPDQLKSICESAGIISKELQQAIGDAVSTSKSFIQHGRALLTRKISLTYFNEEFNQGTQVDFTYVSHNR